MNSVYRYFAESKQSNLDYVHGHVFNAIFGGLGHHILHFRTFKQAMDRMDPFHSTIFLLQINLGLTMTMHTFTNKTLDRFRRIRITASIFVFVPTWLVKTNVPKHITTCQSLSTVHFRRGAADVAISPASDVTRQ